MYKFLKLVVIFILGMDAVATAQIFTFTCPTTTATWTVPVGVTKIHIDMAGGKGGTNSWPVTGGPAGGPYATTFVIDSAGHGARVEADLNVTPGQVFTINVGQKGLMGLRDKYPPRYSRWWMGIFCPNSRYYAQHCRRWRWRCIRYTRCPIHTF